MTVFGSAFNAIYLIPKFAQLYGLPLESIIEMGHAINPAINSVSTLALFAVVPMNLLKGTAVSVVTVLVYKKLARSCIRTDKSGWPSDGHPLIFRGRAGILSGCRQVMKKNLSEKVLLALFDYTIPSRCGGIVCCFLRNCEAFATKR